MDKRIDEQHDRYMKGQIEDTEVICMCLPTYTGNTNKCLNNLTTLHGRQQFLIVLKFKSSKFYCKWVGRENSMILKYFNKTMSW